jgi:hypothetical protein
LLPHIRPRAKAIINASHRAVQVGPDGIGAHQEPPADVHALDGPDVDEAAHGALAYAPELAGRLGEVP